MQDGPRQRDQPVTRNQIAKYGIKVRNDSRYHHHVILSPTSTDFPTDYANDLFAHEASERRRQTHYAQRDGVKGTV